MTRRTDPALPRRLRAWARQLGKIPGSSRSMLAADLRAAADEITALRAELERADTPEAV